MNKNCIFSYYSGAEHYLYNTTPLRRCGGRRLQPRANVTAEHQKAEERTDSDGGLLASSVTSQGGFLADKGCDGCRGERRPVGWLCAKTVGEEASDQVAIALAGAQSEACHVLKMGVICL